MAITALEYTILIDLRRRGLLPAAPHVLELGMQNWYGDVSFKAVSVLADELLADEPDRLAEFKAEYGRIVGAIEGGNIAGGMRQFAKLFYRLVLEFASYSAIDLDDVPDGLKHDLNHPVPMKRRFDLVTNIGTAEHVFDIAQVFATVHDRTEPGGLMIHTAPVNGWWDHGFYAVQPTLYFDVAAANGYETVSLTCATLKPFDAVSVTTREDFLRIAEAGRLGTHAVVNCVLRKGAEDAPFRVPIQGIYAGTVSSEAAAAWRKLR